ncbi:polysaccharide biosynthesis tyrosine autokinase [Chryseolinea sp. T2]|uniref:GumC family protein n=1 Tax=Chryseolinea sp. T2 TaxID=3129255 RepID=UPI003076AF9C
MSLREKLGTEENVDLRQIISRYGKYWYVFVLSLVVCVGLAFGYLYQATPQYKISSSILLKNEEADAAALGNGNQSLGEINFFSTKQRIDNEIEVLRANSLMHRVFNDLGLNATYYINGRFKKKEIYGSELPIRLSITKLHPTAYGKVITVTRKTSTTFELSDDEGDVSSHKFGEEVSKPYGIFTVIAAAGTRSSEPIDILFHDINKLANSYNEVLKVEAINKKASVITISLIESVPQKGKDIINKLLELYREEALEDRNLVAKTTISFIDDRLKFLTSEITDVEKNVEQFKQANEVTDVASNAGQYLTEASESNRQLSEIGIQIDVLESIENYINNKSGKLEMVPSNLSIEDPTLAQLITKFNELQLERERMLRTTLPGNPLVQDLNEQLGSLQLNILENLHNIKSGLLITQKRLQSNSGRYRSQIQKVPSIERNLLEISRQQGIKGNLYLYLLQKREESALALEVTVPKTRTLDPAIELDRPVSPKPALVYLMAIVLGIGIPFSGIYVKGMLNDKIETKRDVRQLTETPILGEISHNNSGRSLIVTEDTGSSIAELFRLIRSNLQFATAGKENKVVMITSSASGEGKTFFSINLAASLTLVGKKVALLELDLRMPSLSKQLGRAPGMGISDYLVGAKKISIEDIIRPHNTVPGLYIASAGSLPPNPAELMTSPNLAYLINSLKASFDYVIIDTAPVGKVADAFSLGPLIDSTIYIIRSNYTTKASTEIIDDIYTNNKLAHPMIVVNDTQENSKQSYGYGYSYGSQKKKKKDAKEFSIS